MAQTEFRTLSREEFQAISESRKFRLEQKGDQYLVEKVERRGRPQTVDSGDYEDFEQALNRDTYRFYKDMDLGSIKDKRSFDAEFSRLVEDQSVWSFGSRNNPHFGDEARKVFKANKDLIAEKVAYRYYSYKSKATGKFLSKTNALNSDPNDIVVIDNFKSLKTGKILKRDVAKKNYVNALNKGKL